MSRSSKPMNKLSNLLHAMTLAVALPATMAGSSSAIAADSPSAAPIRDESRDFEFLAGCWYAHSRRLVSPLSGSNKWEEFDSVHDGVLLPSGFGVADDFRIEGRPEFVGLALQIYDTKKKQWQAYWYRLGKLTPPLIGKFVNGVGVFEGPDKLNGKPIITRYTWSKITATSARWEQAFSADSGKTWETNWIMEYRRTRSATSGE